MYNTTQDCAPYLPLCTITLCSMFILYIVDSLQFFALLLELASFNLIVHVYSDNKGILFYSILFYSF